MNIEKLQRDVLLHFKNIGLENSLKISKSTGISQSTVYRSLFVPRKKLTKGLEKLVKISKINTEKYLVDPSENVELMRALKIVWNGTDSHAKQLSRLLLTAHSCRMASDRT